jgi:DNA replication protein DnaC
MEVQQQEARRQFLSQMLSKCVVANATYDDQGEQPCDSDTRIDVLADIRQWASDISEHTYSFLWLTGKPGCGKSAVTASVARECKDLRLLWAQFFINRNIEEAANPAFFHCSPAR